MKELKCPHCGNVFTVDENDYAALLNQVKNAEFNDEVTRRIHEYEQAQKERMAAEKVAEEARKETEAVRLQNERIKLEQANQEALLAKDRELQLKLSEISLLKQQIQNFETVKKSAVQEAVAAKDQQILQLENDKKLAASEAQNEVNRIKEDYEHKLKEAETEVELYRDLKSRMSTKMVGETLEQHCASEFETIRPYLPNAYFEKDNDASEGTKGDFIFRLKAEDNEKVEVLSIMFEMKNETDDTTSQKKTNAFHLAKLDQDRQKKNCEYAVLVSLLEPDSEVYNRGIVDMSHKYQKMYVIRPQFFVPLITLLVNEAKKSMDYKQQLLAAQSQQVDVTDFEDKLAAFQDAFGKHVLSAHKNYEEAIKQIETSIKNLEKVRDSLKTSANQLRLANNNAMDLTIKKLTYGNPTMRAKFDEARQQKNLEQDKTEE